MSTEKAFTQLSIGPLSLRNRFIKSATYEGMTPDGRPTVKLAGFHKDIAAGGVALNTVAYGAVEPDGRTHTKQLLIDHSSAAGLEMLADKIHEPGGKASMQLTHCGFFTRNTQLRRKRPVAPSRKFNAYGLMSGIPFARPMSIEDINRVTGSFAAAARLCAKAGFDAVEIHMGHGYLLSQFLTPSVNRRTDRYGGSIHNRARFPLEVLEAVKSEISGDLAIFVKINLNDGFSGGITTTETIKYIRLLHEAGADAFVLSGSYTSKTPFYLMRGDVPLSGMISVEKNVLQKIAIAAFGPVIMKHYPFEENYFLDLAREVRTAVKVPLVYQGGVVSTRGVLDIMNEGFDMIGLGRALIHDSGFVNKLALEDSFISPCNHCNMCMVEMDRGGVTCVLN